MKSLNESAYHKTGSDYFGDSWMRKPTFVTVMNRHDRLLVFFRETVNG